jgi:membrane protease YdiL (CAAX protease family)
MNITENQLSEGDNQPFLTGALGLLAALFGFYILGPLIGSVAAIPFFENGLSDMMELGENPTGDVSFKIPLFIIQGVAALIGLIIIPWLFLYIRKDQPSKSLFPKSPGIQGYFLTALVVFTFMGVNSFFIEWNASVHFPEFMKPLEDWARKNEDMLAEATTFLTTFESTGQFILAFFVIAVIPGIGEELVFRGIVQRKLIQGGLNPHIAIWLAAIIFSAIHIQFFGFVPRMLLGVLFGYLYFWSGDLRVPMFAHFVNNGLTLGFVYAHQMGWVDFDIENSESPTLVSVIIFCIITTIVLVVLNRYFNLRKADEPVEGSF